MESCRNLPELTIDVADAQNDVFRLLEVIKPDWKKDLVKVKVLSGGFSCCMLRCAHESGDMVTVRIRNELDGVRDPAHEKRVVKVMSTKGCFPPVLATFQNGFCYEYIPGVPLVTKGASEFKIDENQLRLIAEQMANIHTVIIPEYDYTQTNYFDFYIELLSTSKPWFDGCPPIEKLKEEILIVKELVSVVQSPLVLIHGDPHSSNFVWNQQQNKITFVDWELSQVAPRASDIAFFLNSIDHFGDLLKCPVTKPDDIESKLCNYYLEKWNELHGKPSPNTDEKKQLLREIKYFTLMVRLAWVVYVVKFDTIMVAIGPPESLWKHTFGRYLSCKEGITGIKTLGQAPS